MTDAMTLLDARAHYYQANGFASDGGDSLTKVPVKLLGMTFHIPNTDGRRRAVKIHDLHHIVTGYQTDLRGETEIAAWELASDCTSSTAATVLNLFALAIGAVIAPRRIVRAWARGRHTRNLYGHDGVTALLPRAVGEVRTSLGLAGPPPRARVRDAAAVGALAVPMLGVMTAVVLGPLVALALAVAAIA